MTGLEWLFVVVLVLAFCVVAFGAGLQWYLLRREVREYRGELRRRVGGES